MVTTIAAISTPLGEGGVGMVRISGDDARSVADKIFISVSGKKIAAAKGYTALFGKAHNGGEPIDEAVALVFAAPRSYTGEDVVEISVHGGRYVTKTLLRAALDAGAVPAQPGEFTRRAFQNGKIDLAEAESVMGLISAKGAQALHMAQSGKDGKISKKISEIRDSLLGVCAAMSVYADYPDEDIPELKQDVLYKGLADTAETLRRMLRVYDAGSVVREGISTVIIGAPNVGKSTLMNLLSGDEKSIVTATEGTTRDIVEDTVAAGDVVLRLADTAGIRDSADEVESIGVSRALKKAEQAQLVLAVFDGSEPLDSRGKRILEFTKDRLAIAVINKSDIGTKLDTAEFGKIPAVTVSAKTGEGADELISKIAEVTGVSMLDPDAAVLATERQRDCAKRALAGVDEALTAIDDGYTLDAVGICVDDALAALLELTGERVTNAVVDEVFKRFCVGK